VVGVAAGGPGAFCYLKGGGGGGGGHCSQSGFGKEGGDGGSGGFEESQVEREERSTR
jgi:hypothetical protein